MKRYRKEQGNATTKNHLTAQIASKTSVKILLLTPRVLPRFFIFAYLSFSLKFLADSLHISGNGRSLMIRHSSTSPWGFSRRIGIRSPYLVDSSPSFDDHQFSVFSVCQGFVESHRAEFCGESRPHVNLFKCSISYPHPA